MYHNIKTQYKELHWINLIYFTIWYKYIATWYKCACELMVIVVGNGHGDLCSIPGRGCLHFTYIIVVILYFWIFGEWGVNTSRSLNSGPLWPGVVVHLKNMFEIKKCLKISLFLSLSLSIYIYIYIYIVSRLSSLDSVARLQILDETFCISNGVNTIG